jgi:DNA-binding HxlR family transcriptional regulator
MKRKSFVRMNCSIAQSLEVVGEWWTLLIVREAILFGARRFGEFQESIGIADNILADRLRKLVGRGVLERIPSSEKARRTEYRLTEMGRALFPVVIALMQWGDRWIAGARRVPVKILERASGVELPEIKVQGKQGVALAPDDVVLVAGPGATADTKTRLNQTSRSVAPAPRRRASRSRRMS